MSSKPIDEALAQSEAAQAMLRESIEANEKLIADSDRLLSACRETMKPPPSQPQA